MKYRIEINGKVHDVEVKEEGSHYTVTVDGVAYRTRIEEVHKKRTTETAASPVPPVPAVPTVSPVSLPVIMPTAEEAAPGSVTAPMPGTILKVHVSVGDTVAVGDVLLMLEAMKMENEISSPVSGVIREVHVREGQPVNAGDVLVVIRR